MDELFPLKSFANTPAIIDGDHSRIITYKELDQLSRQAVRLIGTKKTLIFLFCRNYVEDVVAYIGAMNAGHVVCLLDAMMHESFKRELIKCYSPDFIFDGITTFADDYERVGDVQNALIIYRAQHQIPATILYPNLHLLLATSGTTGSPKLIRLSKKNIESNAQSIIEYLSITAKERAIATLPMHYSYGLSVLHTHLLAGASIVLTQASVAQDSLWKIVKQY